MIGAVKKHKPKKKSLKIYKLAGQRSFTFLENKNLIKQVLTTRKLAHNASTMRTHISLPNRQSIKNTKRELKVVRETCGNRSREISKLLDNISTCLKVR